MSVLGAIFGRSNTIDRLSTQDLRKEKVKLEVQEQKLSQQLRKLEADAAKMFQVAASGTGGQVDDRIAGRRILEIKSKKSDLERQALDVSQKISALGRLSRAKDRQKELEQKGLWSKISNMPIDDLEDIINKWLDENENKFKIIDKQVNAVSTGEMNGKLFQSLIVCIWYE